MKVILSGIALLASPLLASGDTPDVCEGEVRADVEHSLHLPQIVSDMMANYKALDAEIGNCIPELAGNADRFRAQLEAEKLSGLAEINPPTQPTFTERFIQGLKGNACHLDMRSAVIEHYTDLRRVESISVFGAIKPECRLTE